MANVDTAGFKQDVPLFQARFAEAIQRGQARPGDGSINDIGGGVKIIEVATDYSPGAMKRTGGDLDLAITGKGFFHVAGEDGEQYLSRAGAFAIDVEGRLVTQNDNRAVLDQDGSEILLAPNLPFSISQDGFITQDGSVIPLGLSEPESMDDMIKAGSNMWKPLGPVKPLELNDRDVRQGFLEVSGANPVRQMMAMIETTRHSKRTHG